jgi:hypothetical protein
MIRLAHNTDPLPTAADLGERRSGPAPRSEDSLGVRVSGPAPAHSVPRDAEFDFETFDASPPSVRDRTTDPKPLSEPPPDIFGPEAKTDEIPAEALLRGIENDAPSRSKPKLKPRATPEAFEAGSSSASHLPVAPPARYRHFESEPKVQVNVTEPIQQLPSADEEITNPSQRIRLSDPAPSERRVESSMPPPSPRTILPGPMHQVAIDIEVPRVDENARRQEKTVGIPRSRSTLPAMILACVVFVTVFLLSFFFWPGPSRSTPGNRQGNHPSNQASDQAPVDVNPTSMPGSAKTLEERGPLPEALTAPVLVPAFDEAAAAPQSVVGTQQPPATGGGAHRMRDRARPGRGSAHEAAPDPVKTNPDYGLFQQKRQ